jgi:hypothetical protein
MPWNYHGSTNGMRTHLLLAPCVSPELPQFPALARTLKLAEVPGLEPRTTESKSVELPITPHPN